MAPAPPSMSRWSLAARVIAAAMGLLGVLLVIVVLTHERVADERRDAEIANAVDTGGAVAGMIDEFARNLETSLLALSIGIANGGPINQAAAGPALSKVSDEVGVLRGLFV